MGVCFELSNAIPKEDDLCITGISLIEYYKVTYKHENKEKDELREEEFHGCGGLYKDRERRSDCQRLFCGVTGQGTGENLRDE